MEINVEAGTSSERNHRITKGPSWKQFPDTTKPTNTMAEDTSLKVREDI